VKESYNLPNGVVWIYHSSVVGKGKQMVYAEKK